MTLTQEAGTVKSTNRVRLAELEPPPKAELRFRTPLEGIAFDPRASLEARFLVLAIQKLAADKPAESVSLESIMELTGWSKRTIRRWFASTEALGWLDRVFDDDTHEWVGCRFRTRTAQTSVPDPSWAATDDRPIFRTVYDAIMFHKGLSIGARFLLLALLSHARDGVRFSVRLSRLADKLNRTVRGRPKSPNASTIGAWLGELKASGIVTLERDPARGKKWRFEFRVKVGPNVPIPLATVEEWAQKNAPPVTEPLADGHESDRCRPQNPGHVENVTLENEPRTFVVENAAVENRPGATVKPPAEPIVSGSSDDSQTKVCSAGEREKKQAARDIPQFAPMPNSDDPAELVAWVAGFRPDLVPVFAGFGQQLPGVWLKALAWKQVVGQPNVTAGLLTTILTDWGMHGRCEYIPGSSLENPKGVEAQSAAVAIVEGEGSPAGDSASITIAEEWIIGVRREAERRLPGGAATADQTASFALPIERMYLFHLWNKLDKYEKLRLDRSTKQGREAPKPLESKTEIRFATARWDQLSVEKQEQYRKRWSTKPPRQYMTAETLAEEERMWSGPVKKDEEGNIIGGSQAARFAEQYDRLLRTSAIEQEVPTYATPEQQFVALARPELSEAKVRSCHRICRFFDLVLFHREADRFHRDRMTEDERAHYDRVRSNLQANSPFYPRAAHYRAAVRQSIGPRLHIA